MKILKLSFKIFLTIAFAYLWILSFYQFAKHPTRKPKHINNENNMDPIQSPNTPAF